MKASKFILAIIAALALVFPGVLAGSYFFDGGFGGRGFDYGGCPYGGYYCDGFGQDYVSFITGAGVRPKLADLETTPGTFTAENFGPGYLGSPFNQRIRSGGSKSNIFYGASSSPVIVAVPSYYGLYKDSPLVKPVKRIEMGKSQEIFGSRGFTTTASTSRRKRIISGGETFSGPVRGRGSREIEGRSFGSRGSRVDERGRKVFNLFS